MQTQMRRRAIRRRADLRRQLTKERRRSGLLPGARTDRSLQPAEALAEQASPTTSVTAETAAQPETTAAEPGPSERAAHRATRRRRRTSVWQRLSRSSERLRALAQRVQPWQGAGWRELAGPFAWLLAGLRRYPWSSLAAVLVGYALFPLPLLELALSPLTPAAPGLALRLLGGVAMAVVLAMAAALLEPLTLRCLGARPLCFEESSRLRPLLERAAAGLGMTALPRLLVWERREPAASAYLRHVVVSSSLPEMLDDEQLTGLLAHTLAHWRDEDAVGRHLVVLLGLPLSLAYALIDGLMRLLRDLGETERPMALFVALAGLGLALPWLYCRLWLSALTALVRWEAQDHELDADLAATQASAGAGLLRALERLRTVPVAPRGLQMLLADEPPPSKRRLEVLARTLKRAEYRAA